MINKIKLYQIKCDKCRKTYKSRKGITEYAYYADAEAEAQEDDWLKIGKQHYCPICKEEVIPF